MSRFASSYTLGRPTRRCAATSRELAVGESYIATLHDEPSPNPPRRVDYSLEAWREVSTASTPGLLAFWKATVPDPHRKHEHVVLDDDALTDLFEQTENGSIEDVAEPDGSGQAAGTSGVTEAVGASDASVGATSSAGSTVSTASTAPAIDAALIAQRRAALRFVVALLMIRRKLLVLETTRPGLMLVRHKSTPRPPEGPALIEVRDPGVDEATVISVIAELEGNAPTPSGSPA